MDLASIRGKYTTKNFDIKDLNKNPFKQFESWFNDAINENLLEPNAFSLSTVGSDMMPSIRTVLLKYFDNEGFVFFTNYESKKASKKIIVRISEYSKSVKINIFPSFKLIINRSFIIL